MGAGIQLDPLRDLGLSDKDYLAEICACIEQLITGLKAHADSWELTETELRDRYLAAFKQQPKDGMNPSGRATYLQLFFIVANTGRVYLGRRKHVGSQDLERIRLQLVSLGICDRSNPAVSNPTSWKAFLDHAYGEICKPDAARRRELLAKLQAKSSKSIEPDAATDALAEMLDRLGVAAIVGGSTTERTDLSQRVAAIAKANGWTVVPVNAGKLLEPELHSTQQPANPAIYNRVWVNVLRNLVEKSEVISTQHPSWRAFSTQAMDFLRIWRAARGEIRDEDRDRLKPDDAFVAALRRAMSSGRLWKMLGEALRKYGDKLENPRLVKAVAELVRAGVTKALVVLDEVRVFDLTEDLLKVLFDEFYEGKEARNLRLLITSRERNTLSFLEAENRTLYFNIDNNKTKGRIDDSRGIRDSRAETASRAEMMLPASNIPIGVPTHFMERKDALAEIERNLKGNEGRVVVTALHGMRGVGKTVLAAAYAQRHRAEYRATWWIRAQAESTMRADLLALGSRIGWIGPYEKEERALAAVMERLWHEGERILLIYDNAFDANSIKPYLPRGGDARVLVTSNGHAWRGVATPVEIRVWPKAIGADYLIARTGRQAERAAAERLSETLGGLALAHEQAAAYCERLNISLAEYRGRFEAAPARFLNDTRDAPADYNDGMTAAKSFALAIEEATRLHPAAEALIAHAALLAPEPVPLFLFSEAREKFGEPFASMILNDGLEEAVAALMAFALVDRKLIADEHNPSIATDCIQIHHLVREVAVGRQKVSWWLSSHVTARLSRFVVGRSARQARERLRWSLAAALALVYPSDGDSNPASWPRCARLTPHLLAICDSQLPAAGSPEQIAFLLDNAARYFVGRSAFSTARPLEERIIEILERAFSAQHLSVALALENFAMLLDAQGDLAGARPPMERALAIREQILGPEHPSTVRVLIALNRLVATQGDIAGARTLGNRALALRRKMVGSEQPELAMLKSMLGPPTLHERALELHDEKFGPEHRLTTATYIDLIVTLKNRDKYAWAWRLYQQVRAIGERIRGRKALVTAESLNDLGRLLQAEGDLMWARSLFEQALAAREKDCGHEHPDTAETLNDLGVLLHALGEFGEARPLLARALAVREKVLGPEHHITAISLDNLGLLLQAEGNLVEARPLFERSLAIRQQAFGLEHPRTAESFDRLADLLELQGELAGARDLLERALAIREKAFGPEHLITAQSLDNLTRLLLAQGRLPETRDVIIRALAIREKVLGPENPATAASLAGFALSLQTQGDLVGARTVLERALAIRQKVFGSEHLLTAQTLYILGILLRDMGDLAGARPLLERALRIRGQKLPSQCAITAGTFNDYVSLLVKLREFAEAWRLLEWELTHDSEVFGPGLLDIARYRSNLAAALSEQDGQTPQPLHKNLLAICDKAFGPAEPETAKRLRYVARGLYEKGDPEAARHLYERVLAIREEKLGPTHLDTAGALVELAHVLRAQRDFEEAGRLCERSLTIVEEKLGLEHPDTAATLTDLAIVLEDQGKLVEAERVFERALAIFKQKLDLKHVTTACCLNLLGLVREKQGKFAESQPLYERALAIFARQSHSRHLDTARTLNRLASVLHAQRNLAGARALSEGALAIFQSEFGSEDTLSKEVRRRLDAIATDLSPRLISSSA